MTGSTEPPITFSRESDTPMTQTSCNAVVDDYDSFLAHVSNSFLENCGNGSERLFTTDAEGLWDLYLGSFTDPADRQHHNCHACQHFIERYGALVTVDNNGRTASAVWAEDGTPLHFRPAVAAMDKAVRRAKVTGVFLSSDKTWGTPKTGPWRHLAVRPTPGMVLRRTLQTAGQAMAEKLEDFRAVTRALEVFTLPHLETALTLLKTDSLYRSEKVLGQAEWLHDLHVARSTTLGTGRVNVVWRAVATAPAGFCHPRSSMIGTLLEDIAAGKDYDDVARAFAAKLHPLAYQRPQAAPAAGAIAAAEKVMQQLGAAGSLARRFARVDEVQALWRPAPKKNEPSAGGVFGHLKPKGAETPAMRVPAQTMTWAKFERTVLPTADRMEFKVPGSGNYAALVTAVDPDAPPILQWDLEDARNPVSWYVWDGGSPASQWGLTAGRFHEVSAVTLKPSMWGGGFDHQGKGVLFLIADAHETRADAGAALFPEILKSEFHGIRSVIEAYSRGASIEGMYEPHAAGVMLSDGGSSWNATVRVWNAGRPLEYRLDRWD